MGMGCIKKRGYWDMGCNEIINFRAFGKDNFQSKTHYEKNFAKIQKPDISKLVLHVYTASS